MGLNSPGLCGGVARGGDKPRNIAEHDENGLENVCRLQLLAILVWKKGDGRRLLDDVLTKLNVRVIEPVVNTMTPFNSSNVWIIQ